MRIEYLGDVYYVYEYFDENRPQNQDFRVDGFVINPRMRVDFIRCPHELRPQQEIEDWWRRPFIQTCKESFSVYCLDGGAWDRPTLIGNSMSLLGAIEIAKEYKRNNKY